MKKAPGKSKKGWRENLQSAIPLLFDQFFQTRELIIGHPKRVEQFHAMRLKGKTLRYIAEVAVDAFDEKFAGLFEEIRRLVGLMGKVHDCDVHIEKLREFRNELKLHNTISATADDKISVLPLATLLKNQRALRATLFNEICGILIRWEREDFRDTLIRSMIYPTFR